MRKYPFWKNSVYAGEFTVEFTKEGKTLKQYECDDVANGLHIHIHALLLVQKDIDANGKNSSRNNLYTSILETWNALTISDDSKRKNFSTSEVAAIKRSILGRSIFYQSGPVVAHRIAGADSLVKRLNPKGSTFVNLENLYTLGPDGTKYRCNPDKPESFMKGVMECLKYHFEPLTIYHSQTGYDVELIIEMLPAIYRQRLYGKFGAFHGNKELNINFEGDTGLDEISDSMNEEIINPDTNLPAQATDYEYKVYNVAHAYLDSKNHIRFTRDAKVNLIGTFTSAFSQLKQIIKPIVVGQSNEKKMKVAMKIAQLNYLLDTETGEITPLTVEANVS